MSAASLTFGVDQVFDFTEDSPVPASGYIIEASSADDGTTWGNPDAVITSIQSQLLDGSLGKITSFENRTAVVMIRLLAPNMDGLEQGEADLMAEVYRDGWNQLSWTPAGSNNPTVYDVVYGDLQFTFDDFNDALCKRQYTLTLTCLPRPRSATAVTVASLPVPPATVTTVTVDTCDSLTGWAGTPNTATLASGSVKESVAASENVTMSLKRTGSVSMSSTPYLIVSGGFDHGLSYTQLPSLVTFWIDGTQITPAHLDSSATSTTHIGYTAKFYHPAGFTTFEMRFVRNAPGWPTSAFTISVSDISRSNSFGATTPLQQARTLPVSGSARTQASLRVSTTDAALGAGTLVYTSTPQASGIQPPLRQYRVGGPDASSSSTAVSGSTNALATSQASADHWSITASALTPATYDLYAYVSVTSALTVTLSYQASGTATGTPTVTGSRTVTLKAGYQWIPVGSIELPPARVYPGSDDTVNLYLWASSTLLTIDDAYLFSSEGHLTIVDASAASLLLLNSASIDEPEATIWLGKAAGSTGGDPSVDTGVVYAGNRATAWEQHEFKPPTANVFVITPGTTKAQVSMTMFPRWGHHAGNVA